MSKLGVFSEATPLLLRLAIESDLPVLARIHKLAYSRKHFTALLSHETLARYYASFLGEGSEILLAIMMDESGAEIPLGSAVYGRGIPERIKRFKREASKDILITSLHHPFLAIGKFAGAFWAKLIAGPVPPPPDFLLLSIAVREKNCGIGGRLLKEVLAGARKINVKNVGLYVNVENMLAINAYFSAGFRLRQYNNKQFYMEITLE